MCKETMSGIWRSPELKPKVPAGFLRSTHPPITINRDAPEQAGLEQRIKEICQAPRALRLSTCSRPRRMETSHSPQTASTSLRFRTGFTAFGG